ncbi:hypothetical protein [Sphingopyxis sp. PET50]|uniref:hypothetical protein n=1 Tax=Sphingopyxis sp. PET50 TaxID=2976533 RepID=UPI0021B066D2|nr:hypothetical protein [Sphingopyxis sp. PET50]
MPAPDGIAEPQARQRIWDRHASPISILLLGGVLALALAGFAGGQPSPTTAADFGAATLSVRTPAVIRNGEFFETEIRVTAAVPLEEVGIAVSPGLWRDMTINTMIPAAREESFMRRPVPLRLWRARGRRGADRQDRRPDQPAAFRGQRGRHRPL